MSHCEKVCITVLLSEACNLSCKYCYCNGGKTNPGSINLEFVKKGIDHFYKTYNRIFLRFFGNGEPTLEMDKIKSIVHYCRTIDKKSIFELQTNGFFNESTSDWIAKNINIIWISCDGPKDIQDFYRPTQNGQGSSKIVERNIRYLASKVEKVGVRSTIGNKNRLRQLELIDYFSTLGIKYIYTDLMFAAIGSGYFEQSISPMEYAQEFLKAMRYAESKGIFYASFYTMNFDKPSKIVCRSCIPVPHLTIDGYVSCCDMAYDGNSYPELIYGKYNKNTKLIDFDNKKIEYIKSRTVDNLNQCKECDIKYFCGGGCIGESLNEKGSIFKVKEENCNAIRYLAKELGVNKRSYPILHP